MFVRTLLTLVVATWVLLLAGLRAPIVAIELMTHSGWWLLPALLVTTIVLRRASRFARTAGQALGMAAVVAALLVFAVAITLSLEAFPSNRGGVPLRGPFEIAATVGLYAFPWFAVCLWLWKDSAVTRRAKPDV